MPMWSILCFDGLVSMAALAYYKARTTENFLILVFSWFVAVSAMIVATEGAFQTGKYSVKQTGQAVATLELELNTVYEVVWQQVPGSLAIVHKIKMPENTPDEKAILIQDSLGIAYQRFYLSKPADGIGITINEFKIKAEATH